MAANRNAELAITVRWIDSVNPKAKRVAVQERVIHKSSTGSAWEFIQDTRKKAASHEAILLVDIIVVENQQTVWSLH